MDADPSGRVSGGVVQICCTGSCSGDFVTRSYKRSERFKTGLYIAFKSKA